MLVLSGCFSDSILDAMKEEEDFIAPFDVVLSEELFKRTVYFKVPDTGSTVSVASGDDASYNNIPYSMDLEVINDVYDHDDVVVDHVTGLTWTKCTIISEGVADTDDNCAGSSSLSVLDWYKAKDSCKNLTYANHKDWRLPRLPEMLTIVNYNYHPAIDGSVFPNTQTSTTGSDSDSDGVNDAVGYWTYSSKLMVDDNYGWIVFHQGGGFWNLSISNFKLKVRSDSSLEKQFARCVRGGEGDDDDVDL